VLELIVGLVGFIVFLALGFSVMRAAGGRRQ
jgi:hypothetical protein